MHTFGARKRVRVLFILLYYASHAHTRARVLNDFAGFYDRRALVTVDWLRTGNSPFSGSIGASDAVSRAHTSSTNGRTVTLRRRRTPSPIDIHAWGRSAGTSPPRDNTAVVTTDPVGK